MEHQKNSGNNKDAVCPLNDVSVVSNNNSTTIEINTPSAKEDKSNLFKAFLDGNYDPSKDDTKHKDDDNEVFENSNKVEKFKTSESSQSLNILLENIDVKYSNNDSLPRNESVDSLESIEFDNKPKGLQSYASWMKKSLQTLQSWMNQKDEYEFDHFTKTDEEGNLKILSVNSIMELYDLDFSQALNIHNYVSSMLPKLQKSLSTQTKRPEKFKREITKDNKFLELSFRNYSMAPIIKSDLALKLQSQLPSSLRKKLKWSMQFSLNSVNRDNETNDSFNLNRLLCSSKNHGPCLIIIQDFNEYIFGAFINSELQNDIENSYGNKECFIWKYSNSNLEVFRPNDSFNELISSNNEFLSIGGKNDGQYALYLDKRLKNGHSYRNKTFKNKILSSFDDFFISELELWTFD